MWFDHSSFFLSPCIPVPRCCASCQLHSSTTSWSVRLRREITVDVLSNHVRVIAHLSCSPPCRAVAEIIHLEFVLGNFDDRSSWASWLPRSFLKHARTSISISHIADWVPDNNGLNLTSTLLRIASVGFQRPLPITHGPIIPIEPVAKGRVVGTTAIDHDATRFSALGMLAAESAVRAAGSSKARPTARRRIAAMLGTSGCFTE